MDFQAVRAELMRMGDLARGLAVVGYACRPSAAASSIPTWPCFPHRLCDLLTTRAV